MEGQFHVDPSTCASAHDGYESISAHPISGPRPSWNFVGDFERLVGDDSEPDPQFFVESWTLGMAAAVENFQLRRRGQAKAGRPMSGFAEIDAFEPAPFVQGPAFDAQSHPSFKAGATAARWQRGSSVESMQPKPEKERQSFSDSCIYGEELHHPITQEVACRLLGVLATSTRAQIKAAYRHKVSQFHPDRLGCMSEEERLAATERMAAINEAYRLLRTRMPD